MGLHTYSECRAFANVRQVAQMLSALISQQISIQDGNNYNTTYLRKGEVHVSNLTCYSPNFNCDNWIREQGLAHAYGEATVGSRCGVYHEVTDVFKSEQDYLYYCRREPGKQEFAYRFKEYNPNDVQKSYPHFTNRIITASSGVCIEHAQIDRVRIALGNDTAYSYRYTNPTKGFDNIIIPTSFIGNDGTTYIWRAWERPDQASLWACGDRCLWIWVYTNYETTRVNPKFYECPVTISEVSNSYRSEHDLSNSIAKSAVASIALQGRLHFRPDWDWEQFQFYATG